MNDKPYSQEHIDTVLKQVFTEAAGLADFLLRQTDPNYGRDKSIDQEDIVKAAASMIEMAIRESAIHGDPEAIVRTYENTKCTQT